MKLRMTAYEVSILNMAIEFALQYDGRFTGSELFPGSNPICRENTRILKEVQDRMYKEN